MDKKLIYRFHALKRMIERDISESDVRQVILSGKVIQDYLDDQPFPSFLKLGFNGPRPIHVVAAEDQKNHTLIIITAYEPDVDQWTTDFERRQK